MENKISFYNTISKKIELFVPHEEGKVKMYTCGPTVYHFAHIGNLRSYIMEDTLEKFLLFSGYHVKRAMNITDVGHIAKDADSGEDKMIAGAKREHKTVMQIAEFYTKSFFADCDRLNIKKPEIIVPATTCIDEYIRLIEILINKDSAYLSGGNVYFDTSKINDYYTLTGHTADELAIAVRNEVEEDSNKKNKTDFVLWFTQSKFADQELRWDSPWGIGYPGWHIECSAISLKYLGEYLDIHCGGIDNIFPHHTNEIAQSEAILGHNWCKYWFHVQHLITNNGKMSKSSGEFLTLSHLQNKGYDPLVYRLFCLQSHYRNPLIFSYETLDNTAAAYAKLKERVAKLDCSGELNKNAFNEYHEKLVEVIGNDLNTSMGITMLYDVLKDKEINDTTKLCVLRDFDRVFSLNIDALYDCCKEKDLDMESYVIAKIEERLKAKNNKDYLIADAIRNELLEKGVELKDTKDGTTWSMVKV